jgi:A/G-specific adenine glycosylase
MPRAADPAPFAARLLAWYDVHGRRDLPWQREPTPYRVWVSEIMLQQTRVTSVIPFYERFMSAFPTVPALASAPLDGVLALWSGLGYYARARNLHKSARIVVERFGGELPDVLETLLELPGIGRSTGAAILALARGVRLPILDGNVKRVLARYHALEEWPGSSRAQKVLWRLSEQHLPEVRVAAYTQAIMDLGATLCTRARPVCAGCPLRADCRARALGREAELPAPRPRRVRVRRSTIALVVRDRARCILLERRPERGIWGGLLSLPELARGEQADAWCRAHLGAAAAHVRELEPIDHAFTHFDLRLLPVAVDLAAAPSRVMDCDRLLWYNATQPPPGGIPAPVAKLIAALETHERRSA